MLFDYYEQEYIVVMVIQKHEKTFGMIETYLHSANPIVNFLKFFVYSTRFCRFYSFFLKYED